MSTPFLTGSYITVEEYRAAPTAMQTNNLVPGQPQATQDAELAGIIGRASRWIDNIANQSLYATAGQQTERSRVDRDGNAVLRAHQDRVKTIDTFAWGVHQTQLNTFTPPIGAWIEENRSLIPLSPTGSWFGNLPALARPVGGSVFVRWSYTAGWVTTRLSAAATIGASTITVDNPAGVIAGTVLRLAAGAVQDTVTTVSITGNTITLTVPLTAAWAVGDGVSEVPDDIREAAILATTHYIKMRKGAGLVMAKVPSKNKATQQEIGQELAQAEEIAMRYERKAP